MTTEIRTSIEKFLGELTSNSQVDIIGCVDIDKIDAADAYTSIYDMISENGGFDIDIIYYTTAMEYLKENDPSLKDSMELASDLGYEAKNINSELLASLLASDIERTNFIKLEEEINEFFAEIVFTDNI